MNSVGERFGCEAWGEETMSQELCKFFPGGN